MKVIDLNSNGGETSASYPDVNDNHGPRRDPVSAIPAGSQPPPSQQPAAEEVRQPRSSNNPEPLRPTPRVQNRGGGAANNSYGGNPVGRGGSGGGSQRATSREALNSGARPVSRTTPRERGSSPTRRKALRQVDDRNKTTEPPPPH